MQGRVRDKWRNLSYLHAQADGSDAAAHRLQALGADGKPDALAHGCNSYDFGREADNDRTIVLVARWGDFGQLDAQLDEKVVPALPTYTALLERAVLPACDKRHIALVWFPASPFY